MHDLLGKTSHVLEYECEKLPYTKSDPSPMFLNFAD